MLPVIYRYSFRVCCICVCITLLVIFLLTVHVNLSVLDIQQGIRDNGINRKQNLSHFQVNLPSSHRHLFHFSDILTVLPPYFHTVDLKCQPDTCNEKFINEHEWKEKSRIRCIFSSTTPRFKICVYDKHRDKFISAALLSGGVWEPYITKAFQNALNKHPDAIVVDIGANIGYYSLLAAAMHHNVVAIEPDIGNLRRFVLVARYTQWAADSIILLANALSNTHKNVSLSSEADNQGGIRVIENCSRRKPQTLDKLFGTNFWFLGNENVNSSTCLVRTLTLDDLLYVMTTDTAIIKVDIEGYECKALSTSGKFFSQIKVPYILMEWQQLVQRKHQKDTACTSNDIASLANSLTDRGYIAHEVRSGIRLNPYNAPNWRVGDIYWRLKDQDLLTPSL